MGSVAQPGRDQVVTGAASNGVSFGRQTLRRKINTRPRSIRELLEPTIEILCECGGRLCGDRFQIDVELYERVLGSPGQFVVAVHHAVGSGERLVSRHHRFAVVDRTVV